jgi:transposase
VVVYHQATKKDEKTKMPRIRFSAKEKAKAVTRHLQDQVPISTICSDMDIHPNIFYRWQKQFLSEAHSVFEGKRDADRKALERQIALLEQRLKAKDSVIADLLEEYTALKKNLGGR